MALPDRSMLGEINVFSREDGSGTRSEFESLTGTSSKGTDGIALSTEEMIQAVAADSDAIGYIAYSSAAGSDDIKVISIDGVEPDGTTIKNSKYPLCRNYYLAYQDDISELAQDFLRYAEGAGQRIVSGYCIPVNDESTFLSDKSSGRLIISGSSSMAPIIEDLAEAYMELNPNADIEVDVTDSSSGLNTAIRGECDIAMSSRELKEYEEELLNKTALGKDAISVIVNKANPVTGLSKDQIKGIYDKKWESWSDIK